jgi:hypothetical protein
LRTRRINFESPEVRESLSSTSEGDIQMAKKKAAKKKKAKR